MIGLTRGRINKNTYQTRPVMIDVPVKLKEFQKEIIKVGSDLERDKYVVITAARQIGKSFSLRLLSVKLLLEKHNLFIGYFTLSTKLGKEFYSLVLKTLPKELVAKSNSQDLIIELVNHSRIQFFSMEVTSITNVRGFSLDVAILDECAFMSECTTDGQKIYEQIISPLLDARGKKVIFVSTPFGRKGTFWEKYNTAKNSRKKGYYLIECPITSDETKTKDWIEQKKSELSDITFRQEYLCEFIEDGCSFFQGYLECFNSVDEFKPDICWAGLDFSSVGEDNTILTLLGDNNQVKQFLVEGTLDEKYNRIANILNSYSNIIDYGYVENNSIGSVMFNEIKKKLTPRLKTRIVEFNTNSKTKPDMIKFLSLSIEQKNLIFDEEDYNLSREFSVFSYTINPNTKNVSYAALPGEHDDRIMSLALANICRRDKKKTGYKIFTY